MTDWSVDVTALSASTPFTEDDIAQLGKWIDRGVAIGFTPDRLTATFTVQASSPQGAVREAAKVWLEAARAAKLHADPTDVRARTYEELERELREPTLPELIGVAEAAQALSVSKQRIMQLAEEGRLPDPVADLASGRVWTRASIEHFDSTWKRRPGRPPKVLDLIEALKESIGASTPSKSGRGKSRRDKAG